MTKAYRCTVCGYVHEGDAPPDQCPVCGVGAEFFEAEVAVQPSPTALTASATSVENEPTGSASPVYRLIVGGGGAAFAAVESLRAADPTAPIALIHREPELPYDRMSLTRYLAGEVNRDRLPLANRAWFDSRHVTLIQGEVRSIDRDGHRVVLGDGREVRWDRLLLATGAHAFMPSWPGVHREGVQGVRTLDQADAILGAIASHRRVVCIGGGLLGLEAAGALARRGAQVTLLEEGQSLLPRQLARSAGEHLAGHLDRAGVALRTGVKVTEILGDESVRGVQLSDGTALPADWVLVTAGVRPNIDLPRSAGLLCGRGAVVDDTLRTSDPDIFAAGDLAEHRGRCPGLWSVAIEQGRIAGLGLAGRHATYTPKSLATLLKVLDLPVMSLGQFEALDDRDQVKEQEQGARFLRVILREDRIVGANLVGGQRQGDRILAEPNLTGALRRAVEENLPLGDEPEISVALGAT